MSSRDFPTDFPHLLHILTDKVRWFTEEAVRQAHAVIDDHAARTATPTRQGDDLEAPDPTPAPPSSSEPATRRPRKAPVKKPPTARG